MSSWCPSWRRVHAAIRDAWRLAPCCAAGRPERLRLAPASASSHVRPGLRCTFGPCYNAPVCDCGFAPPAGPSCGSSPSVKASSTDSGDVVSSTSASPSY
eukprot:SM000159S01763  [mRNA]  locus=s159:151748:152303:+ [translate_table: standard]